MPESLLKPESLFQVVANCIALASAVAAWFSARASMRAAVEIRLATQANLTSSLLDSYASSEMLRAMILLRTWFSEYRTQSADEFRRFRQTDYAAISEVDHARRYISHFFQKVYTLYRAGFLDESAVRAIAKRDMVEFFRGMIEPLEAAIDVNYDRSSFEGLGAIYGIGPTLPPTANP